MVKKKIKKITRFYEIFNARAGRIIEDEGLRYVENPQDFLLLLAAIPGIGTIIILCYLLVRDKIYISEDKD